MAKVYGLYFADEDLKNPNESWLGEMIKLFKEAGKPCILYFWWHQNPVGREETLSELKKVIKQYKAFPIIAFAENKIRAIFRVEDFANVKEGAIPAEWASCERYDYWKNEKYKEEDQNPKILFKITKIKLVKKPFKTHIDTTRSREHMWPLSEEDFIKLSSVLKDVVPELQEVLNAQKFRGEG